MGLTRYDEASPMILKKLKGWDVTEDAEDTNLYIIKVGEHLIAKVHKDAIGDFLCAFQEYDWSFDTEAADDLWVDFVDPEGRSK